MKPLDLSTVPYAALASELARRNSRLRKTKRGGRAASTERCACGKYTLATAASVRPSHTAERCPEPRKVDA